ncbi:MAG TPA: hypothetical protein VLK65_18440 [Vicinamibacteria bacterium]|nr:hypothetical protein [Vicinamibacteria bacterium]
MSPTTAHVSGSFRLEDWVGVLRSGKTFYRLGELARIASHSEPAARQSAYRLARRRWLAPVGKELYANLLRAEGPPTVEEAAGILYPPAYVSLSSALFAHGIADQAPHLLTCVTTNKTKRFHTGLGEIQFQQIKPSLFFGYVLEGGVPMATPEKAALDFVYLELRNGRRTALDEWNWQGLDRALLDSWARSYPATVRAVIRAGSAAMA